MQEIWKDIKDYEGLYQVSNFGNVRKLRFINNICNKEKTFNITKYKQNRGYLKVILYKDGKYKNKLVHRLVAEAFLDNPNNYNDINHKDGNKENNNINNLEYCTKSYNMKHAFKNNLWKSPNSGRYGSNSYKAKKVAMVDKNTNKIVKTFNSIIDATHFINKNNSGHIVNCCKGKLKTAYGYKWQYIDI